MLRGIGVRGRLFLAFLGISGFAVLGAVAALFAFGEVGKVVDRVTRERVPAVVAALELSRQAERLAAAAPLMLASTTSGEQLRNGAEIQAQLLQLDRLLAEIKSGHLDPAPFAEIEASVAEIKQSLADLQRLVTERLDLAPRRAQLLRQIVPIIESLQGAVEQRFTRMKMRLSEWRAAMDDSSLSEEARKGATAALARSVADSEALQRIRGLTNSMNAELIQASSASDHDLPSAAFTAASTLGELAGLQKKIEPINIPGGDMGLQIERMRPFVEGPDSIPEFRSKELALIARGVALVNANRAASQKLTGAVNRLIDGARVDIALAEADVLATQRKSAGAVLAVVALSLVSSALIVWLYVSRNLIARLTALSGSMLAIARGQLRTPLPEPGYDEIGRMGEALTVFRDTAVEVEEQNLRQRQVVLDTIEYGVLILDPELRVRMWNRAFRELWGVSEEALRDRPLVRDVLDAYRDRGLHGVPGTDWPAYVERRIAEIGAAASPPQEWRLPDGKLLQYEIVALPDGGRMLTYFDLTHLKQVETELRARTHELETRTHELETRTHELEIASRHKSQFLANMSHELRTPLNAILGYTELIVDGIYGETGEKMRDVLGRVQANGKHLLGLINDVLDLSKIEAGQLTLSLGSYSMNEVVRSVFTAVEPLANEKRLALSVDLPATLPIGQGDERRIAQVLLNLVGNAIKFTDHGEVEIRASAANGSFEVAVRDTGPGIAATDQQKIFEEFQQADSSTTRRKGGTGLGLSISRRIIEMHGGQLSVMSEPGRGSTFSFTLPVVAVAKAA
jgi:signal transduction histidine kinase